MEKIVMLGTGHGFVWNLYNTCFFLENEKERLLVDAGGGIEIGLSALFWTKIMWRESRV